MEKKKDGDKLKDKKDKKDITKKKDGVESHRVSKNVKLDFSNKNLTDAIPIEGYSVNSIVELDLSGNSFSGHTLPQTLFTLSHLKVLTCNSCSLEVLPPEIGNLVTLTKLFLNDNKLISLPPSIGRLADLQELHLKKNELKELPPTVGLLDGLTVIELDGNKLKTPPKEVIKQGTKSVVVFMKNLLKGSTEYYRIRLMFVGQEGVGKSTLIQCLRKGGALSKKSARAVSCNLSTDGIDISKFNLDVNFESGKKNVTFSSWDFAGQEVYYATHQFFLSRRSIYLLVWDLRSSETTSRVEYWLNSIQARASNAPVILVGTHLDDPKFQDPQEQQKLNQEAHQIFLKYQAKFPNLRELALMSCMTGVNVKELLELIRKIVTEQKCMGEHFPVSYVVLEEHIKKERATKYPPQISFDEYKRLAEKANIIKDDDLKNATQVLHELGELVHYDETLLNKVVILDPQWIADLFSSIITTKHSFGRTLGILTAENLAQIWKGYDVALHEPLIHLLCLLEVAFDLTGSTYAEDAKLKSGKHILIPSLLPVSGPENLASIWPQDDLSIPQISFTYQLAFLPHGLFGRLMVRLLKLTNNEKLSLVIKALWQAGIVATTASTSCTLLITTSERKIEVTARGETTSCCLMLRILNDILKDLFAKWFRVSCHFMIACSHCRTSKAKQINWIHLNTILNCAQKKLNVVPCQDGTQVPLVDLLGDIAVDELLPFKSQNTVEIQQEPPPIDVNNVPDRVKGCFSLQETSEKKKTENPFKTIRKITTRSSSPMRKRTQIFGSDLSTIFEYQKQTHPSLGHPYVLQFLTESIVKNGGMQTEGIFRIPANTAKLNVAKEALNDLEYEACVIDDPHVAAGLLKLFFRELTHPIIPIPLYDKCLVADKDQNVTSIMAELPPQNQQTISFVIQFLQKLIDPANKPYTKMGLENVALVFAPGLLRSPSTDPVVLMTNSNKEIQFVQLLLKHSFTS